MEPDASTRRQGRVVRSLTPERAVVALRSMTSPAQRRGRGYAYALGAYTIWGLMPAYFKLLTAAPPLELMSHRVLWAFSMLIPIAWHLDRFAELHDRDFRGRPQLIDNNAGVLEAIAAAHPELAAACAEFMPR